MPGHIVFDPDDASVGFSTGDELAVNVFLDIENDVLYFTDASDVYEWEGSASGRTYTWRSGKLRFPKLINLGAALVEANSYTDITFRLYADGVLKHTKVVQDGKPFRLPGGYLSNIYEVEIVGVDRVTGASVAENIFELAAG